MAVSFRAALVDVYATTPVANIKESRRYQALLKAHGSDTRFGEERDNVEVAKTWVESYLTPPKTQAEEVRAALKLLVAERRSSDRDLYRELIVAGYAPGWTEPQQAYFAASRKKITARYDFFLSFTTRYEQVPGQNTINTAYEYLIRAVLGPDEIKSVDRKKTNLLAYAVLRLLTKAPSLPFFFPHSQYDNTQTESKLREACGDCLVFVQLVRNIMFVEPEGGKRNWCHYEYETVHNELGTDDERSHRILFIVTEDEEQLIENSMVPLAYQPWHYYVAKRDPPYLQEMSSYDASAIARAKKLLTEKIRPLLASPLRRLLEEVPV